MVSMLVLVHILIYVPGIQNASYDMENLCVKVQRIFEFCVMFKIGVFILDSIGHEQTNNVQFVYKKLLWV